MSEIKRLAHVIKLANLPYKPLESYTVSELDLLLSHSFNPNDSLYAALIKLRCEKNIQK
tara:strand:+ start:1244 stop:1420 length:177 start_codon:yes stop_codon:yes gene_type:complete